MLIQYSYSTNYFSDQVYPLLNKLQMVHLLRNHPAQGLDQFFRRSSSLFDDVNRILSSGLDGADENTLQHALLQVEAVLVNINRISVLLSTSIHQQLVHNIHALMSILEARLQELQLRNNSPHQMISVLLSGNRGRPSLYIPEDQLRFLVENNFTVAAIAEVFGCSRWTISRRLDELNLNISAAYSGISDADLDEVVEGLHTQFPTAGYRTMDGLLRSHGFRIQRQRIRDSMLRVDEVGVALSWSIVTHRRVYRVHGPNSLWHIDEMHKLIRWKMVIHGGIDGFSRCIVPSMLT